MRGAVHEVGNAGAVRHIYTWHKDTAIHSPSEALDWGLAKEFYTEELGMSQIKMSRKTAGDHVKKV